MQGLAGGWMSYYGRNRREAQKEYRQAIRGCFGVEFRCPWDDVWRGVTLGGEELREKVRWWLKKQPGADERRWQQEEVKVRRREWVTAAARAERNRAVRMWMRVELGGERLVDVGVEEGYANGGGVYIALKRLRLKATKDRSLQQKLDRLRSSLLSNVES